MLKFVNRSQEVRYIQEYFTNPPNALLFLYGPKSSGKSTLLTHVVNALNPSEFTVNFMNLREVLIYDFNTFLDSFFPRTFSKAIKDIADGVTFNIGFFGLSVDDEKVLQHNPFKIMGDKLRSAKARGISPILVIDEIQLFKNIYVNSERHLIDELFNLFVSLTKTAHVAHIVLATSDSYFIEEIYTNAHLQQTSHLYLVDHLTQSDVEVWLHEEGFTDEEIRQVWELIGGSPWEITEIITQKKHGYAVAAACEYFITDKYGKVVDCVLRMEQPRAAIVYAVLNRIVQEGMCPITVVASLPGGFDVLKQMIAQDFWFYRIDEQTIYANARSYYWAFAKIVQYETLWKNNVDR